MHAHRTARALTLLVALCALVTACVMQETGGATRHRWWNGLGPVLPHDSFPAECKLCHEGETWDVLVADFEFDHEAKTGVALLGAHEQAGCLRCHNDRGPVSDFEARGCWGCHEDVHAGDLGRDCESCHLQDTWLPEGMIEMHNRTRFPLVGVHTWTSCVQCHNGAEVGQFVPTDTDCLSCHVDDLQRAQNPNHFLLGYVNACDRCHIPTAWNQAAIGQ